MQQLFCALSNAVLQLERFLSLKSDEIEFSKRHGSRLSDEDHARLLAMLARGDRVAKRVTKFALALKALDALTDG